MKVKPLNDRVLVKRIEETQVTKGGIVIPDTAKEKPIEGRVIAVGSGKMKPEEEESPDQERKGSPV